MTTRDPRFRDVYPAEAQGHGRDPTQSLSLDAALDEPVDPDHAARPDDQHPSLALGTHGAKDPGRTKLTNLESPRGHRPSASRPPPIPPRAATEDPDRVGTTLGSYRILEMLGRGGMGYVYRAEHVKLGREVALKLLRSDYARRRDAVARFFQEARTVNRVRHRNIVDVTDFVELDDGTTFIIMEFLRGESLGNWAATGIDLPRALAVLVQICDGLNAAHEVGVIHRDLKPDNVIIVPTPDGAELVKVLDFGVAKLVNRDDEDVGFQTVAGSVIGTPAYMSPEQAGGMAVDPRSDIYSLGAIMYELFCGQPMFRGRSFGEYVRKHLTEMPPPPRSLPGGAQMDPRLDALIMKCLEKDPIQRFRNIVELRDALIGMLGGMETHLPGLVSLGGSGIRPSGPAAVGMSVNVAPMPQLPGVALPQVVTHVPQTGPYVPQTGPFTPPPNAYASQQAHYSQNVPPGGAPWWVWGVGGLIAVGLGIAGALWYAGRPTVTPAPPAAPSAQGVSQPAPIAEPIVTPPAAQIVEVKLDSTPPGTVFAEGGATPLCQTPCTHSIDPKDGGAADLRRFVVRADGHVDASIDVDLRGAQREFKVTLALREVTPPVDKPEDTAAKPEDTAARPPTGPGPGKTPRPAVIRRPGKVPAAAPADKKPDDPELIAPPKKKPPGKIDPADTLDPFRPKSTPKSSN